MKNKFLLIGVLVMAAAAFSACGGGGSSSGSSGGSDSEDSGTATLASLSTIPSIDLSQYDSSASASADISALLSQSAGLGKGMGDNMREVGGSSRAGCESNMHKQEVFRMSQSVQLDRCYPEAMEAAGLIVIPVGSLAYYSITPPEMSDDQEGSMCDNIPAERTEERAACEGRSEGPGGKTMLLRIGRVDDALKIDMCEGGSSPALVNEATYTASGSIYTGSVVRIGNWAGREEKSSFEVSVDVGATGSVTEGVASIGSDGSLSAIGHMDGGFGSGLIAFEYVGSDASNKVIGAFAGGFTDPFSGTATSFVGKAYSHFGGATHTGCAKFEFTGSMPAMPVSNMVPFDIPQAQLESFLQSFGAELGIQLNSSNYQTVKLCPNPNFDPENPDPTIKPMLPLAEGESSCGSVTHTGTECFGISTATITSDFGSSETQAFTRIANSGSPYYDEVAAYDVSALNPAISSIAFSRNWDCSGTFTELNFQSVSRDIIETEMQKCFALEEEARGRGGMGDYNCGEEEQMNGVNEFKDEGGGAASFGAFGGDTEKVGGNCPAEIPDHLFINAIDPDQNRYCIPTPSNGRCAEFTVAGLVATPLAIEIMQGISVTALTFDANPPSTVAVSISGPAGACVNNYRVNRPEFQAPPEFGSQGGGPGEGMPEACVNAGYTTPEERPACEQLCRDTRQCGM